MCQKLWKLIESRQSYCNENRVQFFGPLGYMGSLKVEKAMLNVRTQVCTPCSTASWNPLVQEYLVQAVYCVTSLQRFTQTQRIQGSCISSSIMWRQALCFSSSVYCSHFCYSCKKPNCCSEWTDRTALSGIAARAQHAVDGYSGRGNFGCSLVHSS